MKLFVLDSITCAGDLFAYNFVIDDTIPDESSRTCYQAVELLFSRPDLYPVGCKVKLNVSVEKLS